MFFACVCIAIGNSSLCVRSTKQTDKNTQWHWQDSFFFNNPSTYNFADSKFTEKQWWKKCVFPMRIRHALVKIVFNSNKMLIYEKPCLLLSTIIAFIWHSSLVFVAVAHRNQFRWWSLLEHSSIFALPYITHITHIHQKCDCFFDGDRMCVQQWDDDTSIDDIPLNSVIV